MNTTAVKFLSVGVLLVGAAGAVATVHYVDVNSTNATPPYTNRTTAGTNIQDAVDAAVAGDEVVVTNGFYATGGRDGNRMKVDKPLNVRSVNGSQFTTLNAGIPTINRCVYLTNGASISGFTLTGAISVNRSGGGVFCEAQAVLSNCVLRGNSTVSPGGGGGAYGGTLYNCTLTGNSSQGGPPRGGGAAFCTLINCTLTGNSAKRSDSGAYGGGAFHCSLVGCMLTSNSVSASFTYPVADQVLLYGGGAYDSTLKNCTLTGNSASAGIHSGSGQVFTCGGAANSCTLNNCTLTDNSAGVGGGAYGGTLNNCILLDDSFSTLNYCWTTDPLFVDQANGNLRLQSNSPCINAGNNSYVTSATDLDGNPRIAGGTVDIGAYEFQAPVSRISYAWLQQFNLPINPSTDTADPDGDGVDNYHEWLAGTDPTNLLSSPAQLTIVPSGTNVILTWSTNVVGFALQSTTNLGSSAVWSTNSPTPVVVNGFNTVTNPFTDPQQFYRLIR